MRIFPSWILEYPTIPPHDQTPATDNKVRRSCSTRNQVVAPLPAPVAREQTENKILQLETALLAVRVQKDVTAIKKAMQAKLTTTSTTVPPVAAAAPEETEAAVIGTVDNIL